jgi:hypothetical protein
VIWPIQIIDDDLIGAHVPGTASTALLFEIGDPGQLLTGELIGKLKTLFPGAV